jgi:hypothetical protein
MTNSRGPEVEKRWSRTFCDTAVRSPIIALYVNIALTLTPSLVLAAKLPVGRSGVRIPVEVRNF